jgi:hypothetical protein
MRKLAITITGIFSLIGIMILIFFSYEILYQLRIFGYIGNSQPMEIGAWIILPTIFASYLFYNLWKKPEFYEKYKLTTDLTLYGIIGTVIVNLLLLAHMIITNEDLLALLVVIGLLLLGAVLSFILGIIGFFIDRRRLKKQTQA